MSYLTLTRIAGDPRALADQYRRSSPIMGEVGRDHGLLVHVAAATDEGLLVVNLWPSIEGSESAAADPRRNAAAAGAGLTPERISAVHHETLDHVIFQPESAGHQNGRACARSSSP